MKILKHFKVIVALILGLAVAGASIRYYSRIPSSEISRSQLLKFVDEKQISRAAIMPLLYPGIYSVEGTCVVPPSAPKTFTITTHLDEKQLNSLLAQSNVTIDL